MRFVWYFVFACLCSKGILWILGDDTKLSDTLLTINAIIAAAMTIKDHIDERDTQTTF